MAKVADGDVREALEAIRAMLAGYAGQPNHMGDVYKIADAALEPLTEQEGETMVERVTEIVERHHCDSWTSGRQCAEEIVAALRREPSARP